MDRYFCAAASRERDELVIGTASRVDRWLLVETSGPWGPRALPQSRGLDEEVVLGLQQRAKASHARLLLFRRPSCPTPAGARQVYAADSRPGAEMLLSRVVANDEELDRLEPPFDGRDAGWHSTGDPLVGVCTQGRHDACCAVQGRPVAAALTASHPQLTVEVSHIGGDRFAANVLVLPAGHYLGQVPPSAAPDVLDELLAGRRPSPYYRGRSVWLMPVQAAMELACEQLGIIALDGLRPRRIEALATHSWRVSFDAPDGGIVAADIEQRQGPQRAKLTCHAPNEHDVPSWHLVRIQQE